MEFLERKAAREIPTEFPKTTARMSREQLRMLGRRVLPVYASVCLVLFACGRQKGEDERVNCVVDVGKPGL